MNDYFEIFSDVVRIATLQPRLRERYSAQRLDEVSRSRPRAVTASSQQRFEGMSRI